MLPLYAFMLTRCLCNGDILSYYPAYSNQDIILGMSPSSTAQFYASVQGYASFALY